MELTCGMPIPGGCRNAAREAVIAMPSIDAAGPMAQWAVHLRCGLDHTGEQAARAIRTADPASTVLVFATAEPLDHPALYAAMLNRKLA